MAEQDDAEIGRIVLERRRLQKSISLLKDQLSNAGKVLTQIGNALSLSPENVVFMGQSVEMEYGLRNQPHFNIPDDHIPSLKQAVQSLRDEVDKLKAVERKAQLYGV